jgi:hypothetical protein
MSRGAGDPGVAPSAVRLGATPSVPIWPRSAASGGAALDARGVVSPRVYRRLTGYFDGGGSDLANFLPWLAKTREQVLDLTTGNFMHLDNVLVVKSGKISMTREPEQLVFVSAKTTNTTIAPWMKV